MADETLNVNKGVDPATHQITWQVHNARFRDTFTVNLIDHIEGNLWFGGVLPGVRLPDDFAFVVALYQKHRYVVGPDTVVDDFEMKDNSDEPNLPAVLLVAQHINGCLEQGKTLVHCQAGLNRSSLVVATALILQGRTADEAIRLLREKRSPGCLINGVFERWVRENEDQIKAGRPSGGPYEVPAE